VITVNELDPLRDEGLAYKRALERAGVPVAGRVNLGLTHGAELIFRQALPAERRSAVADIKAFVDGLTVEHV
jgi:acetyl esterase